MTARGGPRVLYLVYWGAVEPLGQALVLPAVERLQALGARITLVTFDKRADLANRGRTAAIRARLEGQGIRWVSLRYHKRPLVPAKLLDVAVGVALSLRAGRRSTDIVHARTFLGGVMGTLVASMLGARLVYHAEGFYPDEMVDGGAWTADSARHRLARWIEHSVYRRADGVIVVSKVAKREVQARLSQLGRATRVVVVPSVVDLDCFTASATLNVGTGIRLVYSGSVGYRYVFDRAARFAAIAGQELGGLRFRVLTPANTQMVTRILGECGLPVDSWSVESVPHAAMPAELAGADAGLSFGTQAGSERGGSPTKVGEYWACGLPVVVTPNVGDVDAIVRDEGVGVIVERHTDEGYREAAHRLGDLLRDPGVRGRCRRAAERHYALAPACLTQFELYRSLLVREESEA